ncbi:ATP adenylyltransferase family protein [Lusitaniella coriacea]|uniref:ATP adenylyltransferase family protein n=1 Tax=Lusitaniella coriacea TaxID=1983105 RepID=UPI003CEAD3B3
MSEEVPTTPAMPLAPGMLLERLKTQTEYALRCGALQSIPTDYEFVESDSIRFLVRILTNLTRKDEAQREQAQKTAVSGKEFNPFLPYEEDLFVADISPTHLCLLNKYNVVEHHLLIITRAFEAQDTWLTLQDFEALAVCMAEFEGLAFYNGGTLAGASQRHKHLQIVPLPFGLGDARIPIEPELVKALTQSQGGIAQSSSFPFVHAIAPLEPQWLDSPTQAACHYLERYQRLLEAVGLSQDKESSQQSGAYNLLVAREWMFLIPRSRESFQSIAINSLGFAGALLVRNAEQMQFLKEVSPLTILQNVAYSQPKN